VERVEGVAMVRERSTTDFESWLAAREPGLQRTALLLAGDPHSAQDLVQTTLARLYLAWDRIDDHEHVDAYARRVLVNEHRSAWRRPWRRREVVTDAVPATSPLPSTTGRTTPSGRSSRPWHRASAR
jgi:DNA-directed RNA polymerase specialized sigma24 family protein